MSSQIPHILIIGATSAIAEATARLWAQERAHLYLMGRNPAKLQIIASDLATRGAHVVSAALDANDLPAHPAALDAAFSALGRIDAVLIAHGDLPDQKQCESTTALTLEALQTNAISTVSLLTEIANRMQAQGSGAIAVIGSVAGDRGRKSNYVYGSCKALIATFMEGLAGRLRPYGVAVITIKPGFVDTPMTAQFKKGLLWARPERIARLIHSRVARARSGSFYAPGFWGLIMLIIRSLPAQLLYRLNI
jgi:decaprenylphospho-beta-D-erythro-pentofuranosid-2-ulose 2-reductase